MTKLEEYMNDGANYQARAVLSFIQGHPNVEESFNWVKAYYSAKINVARWENCREQGYILSLRSLDRKRQLNIIFYEHRNSDCISAVKWEQVSLNTINIDTAVFGDVYKDKYDTSFDVGYGEIMKMAKWVQNEFSNFWVATVEEMKKDLAD